MKINELAQQTGLTVPTLRFYEKKGLLGTRYVRRNVNNYRDYCQETVRLLLIVKKLHSVGFTLKEIKDLIQIYESHNLTWSEIVDVFQQKMEEISRKQAALKEIQMHLEQMLAHKKALMSAENPIYQQNLHI